MTSKDNIYIEKRIIENFVSGSTKAFEYIFDTTKERLKGFLINTLPKEEDAENVLQDVYLKLWISRHSISPEKNLESYLFTIARNLVIDIMRKRLNRNKYLEELSVQLSENQKNSLDTMACVEYSELESELMRLISHLPDKRQEIFILNRLEGFTYKEIAGKLQISENTVDSQMRKALTFLRKEIKSSIGLILFLYIS